MARCIRFTFLLMVLLVTVGPWYATVSRAQDDATPPVSASPSADARISFILPTEEQVPDGLVTIDDGERTLDDVASGFSDPEATIEQFVAWGWQGNVIRAFHLPEDALSDPNEIDGIYISVHEFGSPAAAAAALDYSLDVHATETDLLEIAVATLGDYSRALYGEMPYGNEITLYVQRGDLLIRLSASSPEGDPTAGATALIQMMLDTQPSTPTATCSRSCFTPTGASRSP